MLQTKLIFVSLVVVLICIRCLSLGEYSGSLGDHDIPKVISKSMTELLLESVMSMLPIKFLFQSILPAIFYMSVMKKKSDLKNTSSIPRLVSTLVVLVYYLIEMAQSTLSNHSYIINGMDAMHLWLPRILLVWVPASKIFESINQPRSSVKSISHPNKFVFDSIACSNSLVNFFYKTDFVFPILWIVGGPNSIFASVVISVALVSFTETFAISHRRAQSNHGHNDIPRPEDATDSHNLEPGTYPSIHVWGAWWAMLIQYSFYSTTHAPVFGALQINRGMTGLFHFNFYLNGALLFANTWGFPIYFLAAFIYTTPKIFQRLTLYDRNSPATQHTTPFLLVPYVASFWWCIALSCFLQRHHLMLWGVFAPRLVFAFVETCWIIAIVCIYAFTNAAITWKWVPPRAEIKKN